MHYTTKRPPRRLVHVLQNVRKHVRGTAEVVAAPVVAARTWLARVGWRRGGPVGLAEAPAIGSPRPRS
jgi:hypothetical protein